MVTIRQLIERLKKVKNDKQDLPIIFLANYSGQFLGCRKVRGLAVIKHRNGVKILIKTKKA